MILDVIYNNHVNSQIVMSYINDNGGVSLKYFNVSDQPYQFTKWVYAQPGEDAMPGYLSYDNKPVRLSYNHRFNRFDLLQFLQSMSKEDKEQLLGYKPINFYFFDIETEIRDGFPDAETAPTPIVSIAVTAIDSKFTTIVLTIDPVTKEQVSDAEQITKQYIKDNYDKEIDVDVRFIQCPNEEEMLKMFLMMYKAIPAISGWNTNGYDWPYIIKRMAIYNLSMKSASMDGTVNKKDGLPNHKLNPDYMELFKEYDYSLRPYESFRLDWVANRSLGLPKLPYPGTLKELRENDIARFLAYNAIDTIIVGLLHKKHNLVMVLNGLTMATMLPMRESAGAVNQSEAVMFNYYINDLKGPNGENYVCPEKTERVNKYKYDGGYVKDPVVGLSFFNACFDFSSLYPSLMRTTNISPTNILLDGRTLSKDEIIKYKQDPNYVVSVQNRLYDNRQDCAYKTIQSKLYAGRKSYQKDQFFYEKDVAFEVKKEQKRRGLIESL